MAVTGTESGDILVFDRSLIIEGIGEQNEKRIIKIVTLNQKQTKPKCNQLINPNLYSKTLYITKNTTPQTLN